MLQALLHQYSVHFTVGGCFAMLLALCTQGVRDWLSDKVSGMLKAWEKTFPIHIVWGPKTKTIKQTQEKLKHAESRGELSSFLAKELHYIHVKLDACEEERKACAKQNMIEDERNRTLEKELSQVKVDVAHIAGRYKECMNENAQFAEKIRHLSKNPT